jgi:hypothetical protein
MREQRLVRGTEQGAGDDGRRRELRALLLAGANAARQGRRVQLLAERIGRPVGRAIRDRVSMLLSAAG